MKRELLVPALVLVPFGVLVALGFFWTREPAPRPAPTRTSSTPEPGPTPPPRAAVLPTPAEPLDAGTTAATRHRPLAPAGPTRPMPADFGANDDPHLAAALAAVRAEAWLCFTDAAEHTHGAPSLEVRFRPLPDGGFAEVEIVPGTDRNPYLEACLSDAFSELGYAPSGHEDFRRASVTFHAPH